MFSTFADTVKYLHDELPEYVAGRERVTVIGADTSPDERTGLLSRFCPDTVVRPGYKPSDGEVDLLLSNDVLSEGQNLQQAAAVISYDMPWNPQRMVQRYGRVIRLKSPHDEVYLTTMLPEQGDLEEILKLEIAIRRKIVAARPYGMEVQVIDKTEEEARAYAQRLADGDTTLLDEDDEAGGTHEFSGEALRAELRRELEEGRGEELRNLPWGIGAAFRQGVETPSSGAPGVFFACRAKGERYWRYVDSAGEVIGEPAPILRRIDPGHAPGVDDPRLIWKRHGRRRSRRSWRSTTRKRLVGRRDRWDRFSGGRLSCLRIRRSPCRREGPRRMRRWVWGGVSPCGGRWVKSSESSMTRRLRGVGLRRGLWVL